MNEKKRMAKGKENTLQRTILRFLCLVKVWVEFEIQLCLSWPLFFRWTSFWDLGIKHQHFVWDTGHQAQVVHHQVLIWDNVDESTYQILFYGLLFSTFYYFLYTADPLTCVTPMQPFATFTWSPPTIPYTHHTISLVPRQRPPIWPTDHNVTFSFLSPFSFTLCILSWSDQSQIVTPHDWDLTIHFAAHEPCAHFTYCLYLRLLYLLQKRRKFSPRTQT